MEIVKVEKEDSRILENLASIYLSDMSEIADFLKPEADGSYKYKNLHYYWQKKELSAHFIKHDTGIIGFILSNRTPYVPDDCQISIHEFFILRQFRRKGLGREAIKKIFAMFPGDYFIAQLETNTPAIEFWHSIYEYLKIKYDEREEVESGIRILTQRFTV